MVYQYENCTCNVANGEYISFKIYSSKYFQLPLKSCSKRIFNGVGNYGMTSEKQAQKLYVH